MTAVLDMHSLPGGAVRNMGYTGRYFSSAEAFTGADEWAEDGDASSLPSTAHAPLRQSVRALLALAKFVASLEATRRRPASWRASRRGTRRSSPTTRRRGGCAALCAEAVRRGCARSSCPAARYAIYLNWFNGGRDWAAWMAEHAADLGPNVIAELHIYHDRSADRPVRARPLRHARCARPARSGMRSLVCQACGPDARRHGAVPRRRRPLRCRRVVLGTCGMYRCTPSDDRRSGLFVRLLRASRSAFCASGAEADFFWTAVLRTGGYDPTAYAAAGPGSRAAIEAELRAAMEGDGWRRANAWSSPPLEPVGDDYLLNWHGWGSSRRRTRRRATRCRRCTARAARATRARVGAGARRRFRWRARATRVASRRSAPSCRTCFRCSRSRSPPAAQLKPAPPRAAASSTASAAGGRTCSVSPSRCSRRRKGPDSPFDGIFSFTGYTV